MAILGLGFVPLLWGLSGPEHPPRADAASPNAWTAYVVDANSESVTPIDTADQTVGTPIPTAGSHSPDGGIAITPDGSTAYVVNSSGDTVTPVDLAAGTAGAPIPLDGCPGCSGASRIAITPDGTAAYVTESAHGLVEEIDTATNTYATSFGVGGEPDAIAISPNGLDAYVADDDDDFPFLDEVSLTSHVVTPVTLPAGVPPGSMATALAFSPDGTKVYVTTTNYPSSPTAGNVVTFDTATNTASAIIPVSNQPQVIAVSPDGTTAYVNDASDILSVVDLTTGAVQTLQGFGIPGPTDIAVTPDGEEVYVTYGNGSIAVLNTASDSDTPINGLGDSVAVAITPDQAPHAALSVLPASAGSTTQFDASGSTVATGSITSFAWNFGDGTTLETGTPTTTHVYATPGSYDATVTETSSGGTSTAQVFTGRTMIRNGGPSAVTSVQVTVGPAPPGPSPPAPVTPTTTAGSTVPPEPPTTSTTTSTSTTTTSSPTRGHGGGPGGPSSHPSGGPAALPLRADPSSGTPGEAVALDDARITHPCTGGDTVYVFFDSQLVTAAVAHGRAFSDGDVVIPGSAQPGPNRFELSCTDVDPWLEQVPFQIVAALDHPMGWVTSLPYPGHMSSGAATLVRAVGVTAVLLALILVYLLGFPAEWFNDTYGSNRERLAQAARRRFPQLFARRHANASRWRHWMAAVAFFAAFVAAGGVINSALDAQFGWNRSSAWLFFGWCAAIAVITLGFQLPALVLGIRTHRPPGLHILAGSIAVAVVCVAVSRLLGLEPGYCYGLIAVFAFRPALDDRVSGRLAAGSMLFVLLLSMVAFAIWVPVQQAATHPHPSPFLLVIEAMLGAVFIAGIESVSFGMLPLPFLPGREVASWNRWVWFGVSALGLLAFSWTLLQPGSGYTRDIDHLDLVPVAATCAVFALVSVSFMAWLRYRRPPGETERDAQPPPAPTPDAAGAAA